MPKKVLWIDTETTGLSAYKNGLTEVAAIMEIDGKQVGEIYLPINPFSYHKEVEVDAKALEITNKTEDLLRTYPSSSKQFEDFISFISQYIRGDKIQVAGYNVNFDIGFLKAWFKENETNPLSPKFSDFFGYKEVDTFALVKQMRYLGFIDTKNEKLGTLCKHYGIELDAHKALDDITATIKLQKKLVSIFMGKNTDFDYKVTALVNESGSGRMELAEDTPSYIILRVVSLFLINLTNTENITLQEVIQNVVDDIKQVSES